MRDLIPGLKRYFDTILNLSKVNYCSNCLLQFRECPRLRHLDVSNCNSHLLDKMFVELNPEKDDHPSQMVDLVSLQAWRLFIGKNGEGVQGDQSGCSLGVVDNKTKVVY